MNQNVEQKQKEQVAQTNTLEMPSSLRMLELSKNYLISIEKKFGVFLSKIGIDAGNYDGNLNGNKTGVEKAYKEKILPLKTKIEKEKSSLSKQDLMMQLTQAVLVARGMDIQEVEKLAREKGKEKEFKAASRELLGDAEYLKLQKDLTTAVNALDQVYTTEQTNQNIDKAKLRSQLSKENEVAGNNFKEGKISKEAYEKIIAANMEKARQAGIELEVTKDFGKYLELGMQSGLLPIGMMVTPGLKRCLPMLPSVIGIGIWARATSLMTSNQSAAEKGREGAMLVGETALTIAPITGTYMSGKETYEAYQRYKNGTGSMSEVVANGIGTGVSAVFDGVTVFLVATGVGAAPAVGLQAVRATAKEAAIGGMKKVISWFAKEGSEKLGATLSEGVAIKSPGVINTVGKFFSGKINLVSSAYKELGAVEFAKRAGRQALEDTTMGLWDIVTLRGLRESKMVTKFIKKGPFDYAREWTSGLRSGAVEGLEKFGLAKRGSAQKIRMRGTAAEFRAANQEANAAMRNDGGASQVEATHAKYKEELSTKHLDASLKELEGMVQHNEGTAEQLEAVLSGIKMQDEYAGHALNVLNKLENKLASHSRNQERLVSEVEKIIETNKGTLSKSLYEYLEGVLTKVKAGENFEPGSGNYLVLLNKINGKEAIEGFKETPGYEEYLKLIGAGEKESQSGYLGQYTGSLEKMTEILFSGKLHSEGERGNIFIKEYMEILKNAERSGWGTVRIENTQFGAKNDFGHYFETGVLKNGYEGTVVHIIKKYKGSPIEKSFLENLDLSLIHNTSIKQQIVERSIEVLKKCDTQEGIALLRHLSFYPEFRSLFRAKFSPSAPISPEGVPMEWKAGMASGEIGIINTFLKESLKNPNKLESIEDLTFLLQYAREKNPNKVMKINITQGEVKEAIIGKLEKIDFSKGEYTKEQIDTLITSLSKIGEIESKTAMDLLVNKLDSGDIHKFMKRLESYESHALFCKYFPEAKGKIFEKVIDNGKDYSIEFKIKFIQELEKTGVTVSTDYLKQRLASYLVHRTDEASVIGKLDYIESFFKGTELSFNEFKNLDNKIKELKNHPTYIHNSFEGGKVFMELVDIGRSFSERDIKDMKNNGSITHKTLQDIETILTTGKLKNKDGNVIKEYSQVEKDKLSIVRDQVKRALDTYDLNLFNLGQYKEQTTDTAKIKYLTTCIEEMIGKKDLFTLGGENPRHLNRTIIKQLNTIKSNFNVEPHIIDGFLYEVLKSTKLEGFNIGEKIKLLQTLERTGIIKPSVELKQEYILHLGGDSDELRAFAHAIKEYTKGFEKGLQASNTYVRELKEKGDTKGIYEYVKSTVQERAPVSMEYIQKNNLQDKKGIDRVEVDGKIYITEIYPSRYFITQLLNARDLRQKETFMELIHNKTDFGGKSFKEYYNEVTDVETKILMSYHDEIKYDPEVIQFLKDHAKSHKKLVMYVIEKRKDYDLIIGDKIKEGSPVTQEMLSKTITKSYVEEVEGKKLSQEEFERIKYGIEKMFLLQRDPEFMRLINTVRTGENLTDSEGNIKSEYLVLIEKYGDMFRIILERSGKHAENIQSLLKKIDIKNLMILTASFASLFGDAQAKAEKNMNSLKTLTLNPEFRRDIITGIRERNEQEIQGKKAYDHVNEVAGRRQNNVKRVSRGILGENKEIDLGIGDTRVELNKIIEPSILERMKDLGDEKIAQALHSLKQKATPKNIMFTLVTVGLMTHQEYAFAEQEIGERWTSSPQYKEYQRLGGEKSAEAKAIKEKAITDITRQALQPYVDSFDAKYKKMMEEKINEIPLGLRTLLANMNIKIKEKISQNHTPTEINMLNTFIYYYVKSIKDEGGACVSNLDKITSKFPELIGTEVEKKLREAGQNADMAAKIGDQGRKREEENKKWEEIGRQITKL